MADKIALPPPEPPDPRADSIPARAQGLDTLKGELVADEQRRQNEARQREAAKAQAALDDKLGPSMAEIQSQATFLKIELTEIQRKAAPATKTKAKLPPSAGLGRLSAVFAAYFTARKE